MEFDQQVTHQEFIRLLKHLTQMAEAGNMAEGEFVQQLDSLIGMRLDTIAKAEVVRRVLH